MSTKLSNIKLKHNLKSAGKILFCVVAHRVGAGSKCH